MISQTVSNCSECLVTFKTVLKDIETSDWKSALQKANKEYNIKSFNLEKLTPEKVKQLYERIYQRFYCSKRVKNGLWIENQLRLYVWILVITSNINNKPIESYTQQDWELIAKIFKGKTSQTCKFQYKSIENKKVSPWNKEQDELLTNMIQQRQETSPNWNQISRDLFNLSNQRYFKTSKQCRQHWNNYLNPNVFKNKWDKKQDLILMSHVIEKGKQWATISKALDYTRTQHMVKNRFKSIILSYSKQFGLSKKHSDSSSVIQKIFLKIKGQCQQLQQSLSQNSKQTETKQKQVSLIKSAFQLVTMPSESDSTTLGLGSSANLNLCKSLSFQFSNHQIFSPFILPFPMTMFHLQPNMQSQSLINQNTYNFNSLKQ